MTPNPSPHRAELLQIIRQVRIRWRWKVALRSVAVLVGSAILTVLVAAWALEQWRFSPSAIITLRIATYVALVALGWLLLVRPLGRRVTDQQVAMYLEEHEASLDTILVSAVDATSADHLGERLGESSALLRRLVESAIEKCEQIRSGRDIERRSLARSAQVIGAIALVAILVFTAGPAYLRQGALALLVPVRSAEAATPYRIEVAPGHATVARGSDLGITARLVGFSSAEVSLFSRSNPAAVFGRVPMIPAAAAPAGGRTPGAAAGFEATLFSLREATEYYVQAAGVRSPTFRIEVADLPHVARLDLEYIFPAYTGLPPQTVENGGDIAVLRGTTVRAHVQSTLPTGGGRILRDDRSESPLSSNPDGTLSGSFEVTRNGFYRIDLLSGAGTLVAGSPQYTIDVLDDQPPSVTFSKPQRDLRPTNIEEVFAEARADDDFGVRELNLVYSINGGPEKTLRLSGPAARPLKQVNAGHTFFLEEMNLKPGDVVSYYARATDNDTVQGPKSASSDMYFLQIRAFRKDYRATESQAGGQSGAAGEGRGTDPSAFSEEQRRIVAATFNVARDREKVTAEKFREDSVFLALAEGQLRERVETLASQITTRVGPGDEGMKKIADMLSEAARAMRAAEARLQARDPKGGLAPEQQALSALQRAEETYRDVRVMMSQERGGGGGANAGRSSPRAEELADLFELEQDRLRNQYETFQQGRQQSADDKVDEMLERLRELARRQEQEAERQRQMAANRQNRSQGGGGGAAGARQRQLADETEQAARQLERLSREENRPDLADAARRMQEAADAMRRAAATGDAGAFAQASAAAERLRQAQDRLERQRTDRMTRDIENARARVQQLEEEQKGIQGQVQGLPRSGAARGQQAGRLMEQKDSQTKELADIERQLDRTASDFRRERPQASKKVQEAADGIRDSKLKEKIRYSKGLVQSAPPDAAAVFEEQIGEDLAAIDARLGEAAAAASVPERDARAEALERARQLLRGMESMDQRLRERGQQAGNEQAQAGQQGEQQGGQQQGGQQQGGQQQGGQQQGEQQQGGQQQGGQQQGGQRQGGQDRGGTRNPIAGGPPMGGGEGRFRPLTPEEARQFSREARQRGAEAEQLRRDLRSLGVDARDLDRLIGEMRPLESLGRYTAEDLARLQSQVLDGFRRFEFDLRRKLGVPAANELLLSGADQAPASYRKAIEEYYRSLARDTKKK